MNVKRSGCSPAWKSKLWKLRLRPIPKLTQSFLALAVARWSRQGRGKRGGVRVIYYYWVSDNEVYMLYLYAKKEQADMDAAGRKEARRFVEALKYGKENRRG